MSGISSQEAKNTGADSDKEKDEVYLYDISQGMAKQLSLPLLGNFLTHFFGQIVCCWICCF